MIQVGVSQWQEIFHVGSDNLKVALTPIGNPVLRL